MRVFVETPLAPTFGIRPFGSIADPGVKPFVVAMVDLDAPTPQDPSVAEIRHFLGGDFVLADCGAGTSDGVALLSNTSSAVSDYVACATCWVGPSPVRFPHMPYHATECYLQMLMVWRRYVFLLYAQPDGFNNQTFVNASTVITGFNISSFAEQVGLGDPLGHLCLSGRTIQTLPRRVRLRRLLLRL